MTIIILLIVSFFIHRCSLYSYFRFFLRYKHIHEIKLQNNKMFRLTGLYLLKVNKGNNIALKLLIIMVSIELVILPFIIIIQIFNNLDILILDEWLLNKCIGIYIWTVYIIMALLFVVKLRSNHIIKND